MSENTLPDDVTCPVCDRHERIADLRAAEAERDAERAEVARLRAAIEAHREVANERLMAFGEHADFDERLWAALAGGGNG